MWTPVSIVVPKPRRVVVSADGSKEEARRFTLELNANARKLRSEAEGILIGAESDSTAISPASDGRGGVLRCAAEAVRCFHALKSRSQSGGRRASTARGYAVAFWFNPPLNPPPTPRPQILIMHLSADAELAGLMRFGLPGRGSPL